MSVTKKRAPAKKAPPKGKPARKPPTSTVALSEDRVIAEIESGKTLSEIARQAGLDRSTVTKWLAADDQRSARAREARAASAAAYDELAEREIRIATDQFELARAKELAHHFRWRAAKIAPREYGEKIELGGSVELTLAQRLKQLDAERVPEHASMPPGADL